MGVPPPWHDKLTFIPPFHGVIALCVTMLLVLMLFFQYYYAATIFANTPIRDIILRQRTFKSLDLTSSSLRCFGPVFTACFTRKFLFKFFQQGSYSTFPFIFTNHKL